MGIINQVAVVSYVMLHAKHAQMVFLAILAFRDGKIRYLIFASNAKVLAKHVTHPSHINALNASSHFLRYQMMASVIYVHKKLVRNVLVLIHLFASNVKMEHPLLLAYAKNAQ